MVGTTVAVFFFGAGDVTGIFLNMSIFFAFATLFPNFPILLYFIIPVPAKWIALFSLCVLGFNFADGSMSVRLAIAVAFANYLLFFGYEWVKIWREQGRTVARRQQFQMAARKDDAETLHLCKECGATEVSAPEKGVPGRGGRGGILPDALAVAAGGVKEGRVSSARCRKSGDAECA